MGWIIEIVQGVLILASIVSVGAWIYGAWHLILFRIHGPSGTPEHSYGRKALIGGLVFAGCVLLGLASGGIIELGGGWR